MENPRQERGIGNVLLDGERADPPVYRIVDGKPEPLIAPQVFTLDGVQDRKRILLKPPPELAPDVVCSFAIRRRRCQVDAHSELVGESDVEIFHDGVLSQTAPQRKLHPSAVCDLPL